MGHVERMRKISGWASLGLDPRRRRRAQINALDINVRREINEVFKVASANHFADANSGCGLPVDMTIREFTVEYTARLWSHGFGVEPSSFAIMEAWFEYRPDFNYYALRPQRDHMYTIKPMLAYANERHRSGNDPIENATSSYQDGMVYNFNCVNDPGEHVLSSDNSSKDFAIGGISIVRHGTELNFMALIGERCDLDELTTEYAGADLGSEVGERGKLKPASGLEQRAVPYLGTKHFHKQLLMARIDIPRKTITTRQVHKDMGNSFTVLTDSHDMLAGSGVDWEHRQEIYRNLEEYDPVLLAVRQFLFLPDYFNEHAKLINKQKHITRLGQTRKNTLKNKIFKHAEERYKVYYRTVEILDEAICWSASTGAAFRVPAFNTTESDGHWQEIPHGQIGRDKKGKPIHGKTWVKTVRSFAAPDRSLLLSSFEKMLWFERNRSRLPNAGWIYIMRSPSHDENVFKVGLTTVSPKERAAQLSSATGVPEKFSPMWTWLVIDCKTAEAEIHRRLAPWRVNQRREFFQAPIQTIDEVVRDVCREYDLMRSSPDAHD